jgi:two-component system, OmpR family, response regulator
MAEPLATSPAGRPPGAHLLQVVAESAGASASTQPRVLVVDDDDSIRDLLTMALEHSGYEVTLAANCVDARNAVERARPDLVVLDVMLPDGDGIELCRRLRAAGLRAPVLFLTARDATADKVRGLTVGGDDYLTKPFSLEELVARVRALLRRAGYDDPATRLLSYADVQIDEESHEVHRGGELVALSPTEFKLLRFLVANAGRVLSKAQILDHVWEYDFGGESSVVETYVSYLRRKLDPLGAPLIHTVRGVGYRLRVD